MANRRGSRLRHVETVYHASRYHSQVTLDCGHYAIRLGHLAVGQRVFCSDCPPRADVEAGR